MEIDGVNPYREICDFDEIKWAQILSSPGEQAIATDNYG
jgi:hypothetical protein